MDIKIQRQTASILAKRFLNGQITFNQFCDDYPHDTKEIDIDSLFELIEHQPKFGGLLGVNQIIYDSYNFEINKMIQLLDK